MRKFYGGFLFLVIFILSINTIFSEFLPWQYDAQINVTIHRNNVVHKKKWIGGKKTSAEKKEKKSFNSIAVIADGLILFFQKFISSQDGAHCKFHPTCSQYGRLAIQKYGVIKGTIKTADRLLRCNPFTIPANDPP